MSSFQDLRVSVHNNTEAEGVTRSRCRTGSLSVSYISTQHAAQWRIQGGLLGLFTPPPRILGLNTPLESWG